MFIERTSIRNPLVPAERDKGSTAYHCLTIALRRSAGRGQNLSIKHLAPQDPEPNLAAQFTMRTLRLPGETEDGT
jgi:hypothetical protein